MSTDIQTASELLHRGELVVFPTETVYGLGADATNDKAVAEIYALKGRPTFNPLIAHVTGPNMAGRYVEITPLAQKLMDAFWPGPLTLVLKRRPDCPISLLASAGLDTLAVRCPQNKVAQDLIATADLPIVAPSANTSGQISPTCALHVKNDFKEKCPFILDGGPCPVGVESTILLATQDPPVLLRYGGLAIEDIERIVGPVIRHNTDPTTPQSPGQMKSHYAPSIPLRMNATEAHDGEALLGFGPAPDAVLNLSPSENLTEAAANLFAMMHQLDNGQWKGIAVMPVPFIGLGWAINDRLKRASYKKDA